MSTPPIPDNPIRPNHYKLASGREVIDLIEELGFGFNLGNALKYMARAGRKGDAAEDLGKALYYLRRELEHREMKSNG